MLTVLRNYGAASVLLFVSALLVWLWYLWSRRRYYRVAWQLPGPWGWPFIGMAWHMLNPATFLTSMKTKSSAYATPFITWMGANCFLYVNDPETVEAIFNSPHCKNKGIFYRFMADAIGDGLFTSSAQRWTKHRRLINPAFSRPVINNFLPIFNAESNALLHKFAGAAERTEAVEIYSLLKKSVLDMSCQTTMGQRMNFQQNRSTSIFNAYNCLTETIVRRMLTPWLYADCIYRRSALYARQRQVVNVVFAFIENLLQSGVSKSAVTMPMPANTTTNTTTTKEDAQSMNKSIAGNTTTTSMASVEPNMHGVTVGEASVSAGAAADDDVDEHKARKFIFVEQVRNCVERGQLTWQDVRDEANVIIAATFETTSTALYFVCLCLAMHAECQDKLYEELLRVFPARDDTLHVSVAQLERLHYTDMVINEAMRLFAPVPIVLRSASDDFPLTRRRRRDSDSDSASGDGNGDADVVIIPRGTQIGIDIYNMQRSERVWGAHATAFRPELHFGNAAPHHHHHPFAFVPFTRGLRMCIGYRYALLLMKLVVVKIFRHYRLHTDAQLDDLHVKGTISLKLRDYPLCTLHARSQ